MANYIQDLCANQVVYPGLVSKEIDLKAYQRLNTLSFEVKAFIDARGGLTHQEACLFGNMMTAIINLK